MKIIVLALSLVSICCVGAAKEPKAKIDKKRTAASESFACEVFASDNEKTAISKEASGLEIFSSHNYSFRFGGNADNYFTAINFNGKFYSEVNFGFEPNGEKKPTMVVTLPVTTASNQADVIRVRCTVGR